MSVPTSGFPFEASRPRCTFGSGPALRVPKKSHAAFTQLQAAPIRKAFERLVTAAATGVDAT
jgi:hypothetical protein